MATRDEQIIEHIYEWEVALRGWSLYPYPVALEPPFEYPWERFEPTSYVDDGVRKGLFSQLKSLV